MMDLREAKVCLEEYCVSLANTCGMLKPKVAEGKLGEAIEKLNDKLLAMLEAQVKEALVLSIMIREDMNERHERMVDFPGEWADVLVALNQLSLATDSAAETRTEYLRLVAVEETRLVSPIVAAIIEYRRTHDALGNLLSEESD
jgi:hypothetical protein